MGGGDIRLSNRMDCHVYLLDGGKEKALIDAGTGVDSETIIQNIKMDGFDPKNDIDYLIVTHAHADHGGGAAALKSATGAELIVPEGEAEFIEKGGTDLKIGLEAAKVSGIYPKDYVYEHTSVNRTVRQNSRIKVGGYTLRTVQVPGHSHGIAGFLTEGKLRSFFSSDIVFINGTVGFGNWPGCNLDNYRRYIGRLANLGVEQLFPGHFMWTLRDGQEHLDTAIRNFEGAWLPPAWTMHYPVW